MHSELVQRSNITFMLHSDDFPVFDPVHKCNQDENESVLIADRKQDCIFDLEEEIHVNMMKDGKFHEAHADLLENVNNTLPRTDLLLDLHHNSERSYVLDFEGSPTYDAYHYWNNEEYRADLVIGLLSRLYQTQRCYVSIAGTHRENKSSCHLSTAGMYPCMASKQGDSYAHSWHSRIDMSDGSYTQ